MNYIYDVILNFNKKLYDFYDWNEKDKINHIRKIPAIKVSTKTLKAIKNNTVKLEQEFVKKIENKTEDFNKQITRYAFLISDGKEIIAIKLKDQNISYQKSYLSIDEHSEIAKIIDKYKETTIKYKIIKKETINNYKTRFEIENEKFIKKQLNKIKNQKDNKKLSYICLECFGKPETNIDKAISKIKKEIVKKNDNFYKIFNIFKIVNQKQS